MRKRRRKIIEEIKITDIVPEGKGLGRKNDLVIFVKDVVPGDVVDVVITRNKTAFKEGKPIKFHKLSNLRIDAKCQHFQLCGGCKWQNILYEQQLIFKQKIVEDAFNRIAKVPIDEQFSIIKSQNTFYYRNKLEYTFSSRRWLTEQEITKNQPINANGLGFHLPGMFDRILDIEKCLLQSDMSNTLRNSIKKFAIEQKIEFFDPRQQTGFLRNLIVRSSNATNEYMLIIIIANDDQQKMGILTNFIALNFPKLSSLYYIVNTKKNDSYADLKPILAYGKEVITEKIGDLKFNIGAKSFFQTNSLQTKKLYDIVLDFTNLSGSEIVYDLYSGTGTIALYVSKKAKKIVGIEIIKEAIDDAKKNAKLNNIENVAFFSGDMKNILTADFIKQNGQPNVVIIDPPRAGIHHDALKVILKAKPEKIVYVSCNPATQARDINILANNYKVLKIQPIDMFPHTFHVENVALLKKIEPQQNILAIN